MRGQGIGEALELGFALCSHVQRGDVAAGTGPVEQQGLGGAGVEQTMHIAGEYLGVG